MKFFKYQKSLKKTKTFKLLLVKFLRKLLLVTGILKFALYVVRVPVHLSEVMRILTNPLIAPFFDPLRRVRILEDEHLYSRFNIRYIFFLKTVPFGCMKGKQRGRLKRKISKKVIQRNRIADAA